MAVNTKKIQHLYQKGKIALYDAFTGVYDSMAYYLHLPIGTLPIAFNQPNIIVYVCDYNWPRLTRMAKWLKRTEPLTICLICSKTGHNKHFDDTSYDDIALFRNAWHLRRIIRYIPNAKLVQGFGPKSYNTMAALKEARCPYIHDLQDVVVSYYGPIPTLHWQKIELPAERYCLEHADGIIAESLEPNVAYRTYAIAHKPKTLFFPLCCDNDYFQKRTRIFNSDDIHIAYAGQVHGSWRDKRNFGNTQFIPIIEALSEQGIHLHIYPSPTTVRADFEEYEVLAATNPFFHYHASVSQETLVRELAEYDFGIIPFFKGQSQISDVKYKYSTTLKIFNFWEAGLPILVSTDLFYQSWIVERYGAGTGLSSMGDIHKLKQLILQKDYNTLAQNVAIARDTLSLKNNITRVSKFYNTVLKQ